MSLCPCSLCPTGTEALHYQGPTSPRDTGQTAYPALPEAYGADNDERIRSAAAAAAAALQLHFPRREYKPTLYVERLPLITLD